MKQTLSLCMIVKNEEKYLHDCLQSVCDIVDQIVIVDTGSEDKTIEIAKEFGAEIHHFDWVDDFSAARNESIKQATSEWILWLDADERLESLSKNEIQKILKPESKPVIYKVQIKSIVNDGENVRLSSAHRLFTNKKGLHFTGKIHEQISISAAKLGAEERQSNLILEHLGYDLDAEGQKKKDRRNLKLLKKSVQEDPQNAYAHFTLAQQYGLLKEWNKALKHYEIAERLGQLDTELMASLLNTKAESLFNLKKYNQVKESCNKSIQKEATQIGAYYMLYRTADTQGETEECIKQLKLILKNTKILKNKTKSISTDVLIAEEKVLYTLALNYLKLEQTDTAKEYLNKTLEINPDNYKIREKLIETNLQIGKWQDVILHLQYLIDQFPKKDQYVELLGTVLIKQQMFSEAIQIYENMVIKNPHNKNTVKKLIGLYGKTGELQKAKGLMQMIS